MNRQECAEMFAERLPDGKSIYADHMEIFGEVLIHILVGEMINYPLTALLKDDTDKDGIKLYCDVIEEMWRKGDVDVVNAMEVSVLESPTYDPAIWQRFGTYIPKDFRWHINDKSIPNNLHYLNAAKLKGE